MLRSKNIPEKHFPMVAIYTVLIVTLVLFMTISWQSWCVRTDMKTIQKRVLRMQELIGIINHLDEVLTMSARMGAETGNIQWEKRYLEFEPQLDNAIKETENLAPSAFQVESVAQTDTANIKLVAMEKQAFELVRQGQKDDALTILFSDRYEEQKRSYTTGMRQITASIQMGVENHLEKSNRQAFYTIVAICITLPILIISWIYVLRLVKKYNIQKKMMEDIILESKEKTLLLLNSTGEAIYGIDTEGKCTFCNPACLRLLGYENESQLLGQHMHDLIHHTRKDGTPYPVEECCIYQAFKGSKGTHVDDEVLWRVDGTSFEADYSSFPIFKDKDTIGSVVCFVDIAERKKIEREVKTLNETLEQRVKERTADVARLSQAIEHSSTTIIITDTEGNIEYANPVFARATGYSIEEAIGKNPNILKSDEMLPEVYEELWNTIKSGKEWRGEFCNKKKNGELYWEHASISPVKDNKGVITNFIAVKEDITERKEIDNALKKSEKELMISEAKFRTWLENSPVCTKIVDLDFNLQYMSTAGIKGLKIADVTQLYGKPYPFDFFPESTQKSMIKSLERVKETGEIITGEAPVADIDGNELWFQATLVPVKDGEGRIDFIIVVSVDINERKKMEAALLQSEKLISVGTITAGISHEFNNLLAIISGNVQLLEEDYKDDNVLTDTLRIIMKATNDGAEISNNMLKFTKTEPDTKKFVSFDIRDLIRHSIDFTKPRWKNEAQARGLNYKIHTESMKSVSSIMCKLAEIREVFINMINNALDAMPDGGSITVSTWSKDDTVFVSVSDSGVGMPENVKKNIFDPFFSTKGVEGTGLGMSMVYGIVTRHGGKIAVDSKIGKGTTFTLQFPATNKKRSLIESPDTEQETNRKSLHILVVDDEDAIRNILVQLLSRSGHNVKTVDNGADAINMVEGEGFDLVLCDLAMPNVFGYDVVKALNGLKKRPKIGIITGWSEERVSDKEMKVDFYLRKPFKHSVLFDHINAAFGTNS